jgi:hypothetical protein
MATTPTFDLSGLPLLEATIAALQAQQAASPASFTGGTSFNVTYGKSGGAPGTMTTAALQQRLIALRSNFDTLAL